MKEQLKKAGEKVKQNELLQRVTAPKNKFWNRVRWIGLGLAAASIAVSEGNIGPDWLQGIAAGIKWAAGTAFISAQLTKP
jgi:hypothetical protein